MAYETRDLGGSMFPNTRKEKETHPDYNGSIRIDGKDYWLSCWNKEGANGPWFSFAFKVKDGAPPPSRANDGRPATASKTQAAAGRDFDDSDIPF